jgi:HPt (histidine-containing phosphotransfer) domain-containing protein
MHHPLVNNAHLQAQIEGDAVFGLQLLQAFRDTAADTLYQLAQAGSAAQRVETLHRLRGASISIGAEALADYCASLECHSPAEIMQADGNASLEALIRQTLQRLETVLTTATA